MRTCLVVVLVLWATSISAAELAGPVIHIVDGDTFDFRDGRIRICGIDAPETGEIGYDQAKAALATIVQDQTVRCVQVGSGTVCDGRSKPTNGNRIVAQCFIGDADIADILIDAGQACDWVRFSGGHYSRNDGKRCR